jgi:hypothetical protein
MCRHIFAVLCGVAPLCCALKNIAALTSQRTNLSPFTKGCRERGVSMRVSDFFSDPLGPPFFNGFFRACVAAFFLQLSCSEIRVQPHLSSFRTGDMILRVFGERPCGRGNSVVDDALRRRANLLVENYSNSRRCGA